MVHSLSDLVGLTAFSSFSHKKFVFAIQTWQTSFPTIANSTNMRDHHCCQWANFTMGPNEQNQHFAELRQKLCLYIHAVVLLRGLSSWEGKNEIFVGKKEEKAVSQIKSDRL